MVPRRRAANERHEKKQRDGTSSYWNSRLNILLGVAARVRTSTKTIDANPKIPK